MLSDQAGGIHGGVERVSPKITTFRTTVSRPKDTAIGG